MMMKTGKEYEQNREKELCEQREYYANREEQMDEMFFKKKGLPAAGRISTKEIVFMSSC